MTEYKIVYDDHRLALEQCPVCGTSHEFELDVTLKPIQAYLSMGGEMDVARTRIEAVFTCPKTGLEFEEKLMVYHRSYERCDAVAPKPCK